MSHCWIMLAINDTRNGNQTNHCHGVALDKIDLEIEDLEGTNVSVTESSLTFGTINVTVLARRRWVGNWCWDAFLMEHKDIARLLHGTRLGRGRPVHPG